MKKEIDLYCPKCGSLIKEGKPWVYGYSITDGHPIQHRIIQCPNQTLFSFGHFRAEEVLVGRWVPFNPGI